MPQDAHQGEGTGKNGEQRKVITDFLNARDISRDYVRPVFNNAVRHYRSFSGIPPREVEGTYSQVMLWFAWAAIQNELPTSMEGWLSGDTWLSLRANDFMLEPDKKAAEMWLRNEMENRQRFHRTATPHIQSAHVMGNGYRFYWPHFVERTELVLTPNFIEMGILDPENEFTENVETKGSVHIVGQHLDFFNVFPSPTGQMINPPEEQGEAGLDWLIVYLYPPNSWLEAEAERGVLDKEQVGQMLKKGDTSEPDEDITFEWKNAVSQVEGGFNNFATPTWIHKINDMPGNLPNRSRIAIWFKRDEWVIVGRDKHVLYQGPPLLGMWPVANFKAIEKMGDFFGTSLIATVEDLITSMIMNFNMRLDYLVGQFHPPTYLPQQLVDDVGGDLSRFDRTPYNTIPYQHTRYPGGLENMIFSQNNSELTQQAFLEQNQMNQYMEEIISQRGTQSMQSETATVGSSLINQDVARKVMRARILDMTGVHDSANLTLRLGARYVTEDAHINTGASGVPWEKVRHEAITDGYGVTINGARHLAQMDEIWKKQMSLAPLLMNDPEIRGQVEMKRQLLEGASYDNIPTIITGANDQAPRQQGPRDQQLPGGIPTTQNTEQSVQNRSSVESAAGVAAV